MASRRDFLKAAGITLGVAAGIGLGAFSLNEYNNYRFRDDGSRVCGTNLVTWRRNGFFEVDSVLEKLLGLTNHISLVTSYFMNSIHSNRIRETHMTPSIESLEYAIRQIKSLGNIRIMLKPHINVEDGSRPMIWPEDGFYEKYFKELILPLAGFAQKNEVDEFCIGTELMLAATIMPGTFEKGIREVRKRFGGKLTFAAYDTTASLISFWDQLDFIGYNHYKPISIKNPSLEEIEKEFSTNANLLENLAKKHSKRILFTEYGCTSLDGGSQMPTTAQRRAMNRKVVDFEEQNNYLKAFYNSYWKKKWCMGGDLWCIYNPSEVDYRELLTDYYWLGKPVETTIDTRYMTPVQDRLRF